MSAWVVAIVGCGASKLDHAAPARELYTGALFRSAIRCAESGVFDEVFILSAKHGVLRPHQVVEPYDVALSSKSREDREWWAQEVAEQLDAAIADGTHRDATLVFLAPKLYVDTVRPALKGPGPIYTIDTPLKGMGIGMQRGWLKRHTRSHDALVSV
jgi:hypothetical protein